MTMTYGKFLPKLLFTIFLYALSCSAFAQCNQAPVARDDHTEYSGPHAFVDVLANDSEIDGEALRVVILGGECGSTGTFSETGGVVSYTADSPSPSTCRFSYQAIDENGLFDQAEVVISPPAFFSDDFETADLSKWEVVCPGCS